MARRTVQPSLTPPRMLGLLALVALTVTVVVGATTWATHRTYSSLVETDLALLEAVASVVHLDEVLTMSARMAAATGDRRWVERYREHMPELDAVIARAQALAPGAVDIEFLRTTDEANRRLVQLEMEALRLVESGQRHDALRIVTSAEYEDLKQRYTRGAVEAKLACEQRIAEQYKIHQRANIANGLLAIGTALSGFALLLSWMRGARKRDRRRHEMQVLMRRGTLGELAASLAHELNQPLAAVMNYCSAARSLADRPEGFSEMREALVRAEQQARRAGDIISRIRAFVHEDATSFGPTDLADVVRDSLRLVQAEARHAAVSIRVQPRAGLVVAGDAVQLQQVFVNLLLNAIDACRDAAGGGEISVTMEEVQRLAVVAVKDNGPGVSKSQERHLFDAFHSTKREGLGLGLSISRGIVEGHGGDMRYERAGDCTLFRVRFPLDTMGR